jgi:hypothetical protein
MTCATIDFKDEEFPDHEFIAECRAYIAAVQSREFVQIGDKQAALMPWEREPLRVPPTTPTITSERAKQVAKEATAQFEYALARLSHTERWAALFAHFGLSPRCADGSPNPDAPSRLLTYLALALAQARHPTKDEPALPFFDLQFPSPERFDAGRTKAWAHWRADDLIASAIKRGCSQATACDEVFEAFKGTEVLQGVNSAKALEKMYIRRKGRPYRAPGVLIATVLSRRIFQGIHDALLRLTRPRAK